MRRLNFDLILFAIFLFFACGATTKKNPLIGKWEEYKVERKNGADTTRNGIKLQPINNWEFTENEFFELATPNDRLDYNVKDSVIYMKGTGWYKIEKLTLDELIVLHLKCYDDACHRSYFKKVKKWEIK